MRRVKPLSVKVMAPSRGVVTRWPAMSGDMLATGVDKFSLPGMKNRASAVGSNVRYEDGVVKRAPGYVLVQTPSNIVARWPMDEDTGIRFDATNNHLDLTETAPIFAVTGKFGQAAQLLDEGIIRPQWDNLVWTLVENHSANGGSASGVYSGASLDVQATGSTNAPNNSSYSRALGTLTYAGPAANCKAHVVVTSGGGSGVISGFIVKQDTTQLLSVNNAALSAPGTYDFTFTVASTAGSTITIIGFTDISLASRLFTYSTATNSGAYSATFLNV